MINSQAPNVAQDDFFQPASIPENFKKAVGVVQIAMGNLGFMHRKLYNVLLANAYEDLGEGKTQFTIEASALAELIGFNSRDYQMIYDHCKELLEATVEFVEFDEKEGGKKRKRKRRGATSLLSDFTVSDGGVVTYSYSPQMAKQLYEPEQYIWMSLVVQSRFSSKYELNLFENCIRYVGTGSTGFKSVQDWRSVLGATEQYYDDFKHLNQKVIKEATKGVNSKSGILVEPKFEREKRKVARIKFDISENPQMQLLDYKTHNHIRQMAVYKDVRVFGLKDVEAISWIEKKGEQYMVETLEYVKAKKPKSNPVGYLVNALKEGYAEKTPAERKQNEKDKADAVEAKKRLEKDKAVFRDAVRFQYLRDQFTKAQSERDRRLKDKLKEASDQETLRAEFSAKLSSQPRKLADFEKRNWSSLLCLLEIREFANRYFSAEPILESDFFCDQGQNFVELEQQYKKITSSSRQQKVDDAARSLGDLSKVSLDRVVKQLF